VGRVKVHVHAKFHLLSAAVMSYRVIREKKLSDSAENNTAVAYVDRIKMFHFTLTSNHFLSLTSASDSFGTYAAV